MLHDHYEILWDDHKNEDLARIKIIQGKWDGLIYNYTTVSFDEQESEEAILHFEYDVEKTPSGIDIDSLTEEDKISFETLLGDILVEIITEGTTNADRANNTNESIV